MLRRASSSFSPPADCSISFVLDSIGADEANRTPDLLITNQLLYQLSYISNGEYFSKELRSTAREDIHAGENSLADRLCQPDERVADIGDYSFPIAKVRLPKYS